MKYSIDEVKLKHLELISSKELDYKTIMTDIFEYKNHWLDRKLLFRIKATKAINTINEILSIDTNDIELLKLSKINYPKDIDLISFQARLEISTTFEKTDLSLHEKISKIIALACFETTHKVKFDSSTDLFNKFREAILNQPVINMLALFEYLKHSIKESSKKWDQLFSQMQVKDPDYEEAGGPAILSRFNLLKSQKKLIQDFSISDYKESFLIPYVLVQWNNLEAASESYIQRRMSEIKERKMRMAQKAKTQ